jgi:aspartate/methionine/tyrosine aminotransferase
MYDQAISLFGLSKTFGLAGLRVGWVASRNREVLARMSLLKDYTTICASAPSEILAVTALRSKEVIISRQLARIKKNIAVLDEFFAEYDDCFAWIRPAGGSICFPRLLLAQGAEAFCQEVVREAGIMLVPSTMFQFGDNHVRVGFGREDLPKVIARFAEYLSGRCR